MKWLQTESEIRAYTENLFKTPDIAYGRERTMSEIAELVYCNTDPKRHIKAATVLRIVNEVMADMVAPITKMLS